MDTEMALRVASEHTSKVLCPVVKLVEGVLEDRDEPAALAAAVEALGILTSNLGCWAQVPATAILSVVQEFVRSTHKPSRNQLAKLLRHLHADPHGRAALQAAMEDESLDLSEEQKGAVIREVFDVNTLAGQVTLKNMEDMVRQHEQTPSDVVPEDEKTRRQLASLVGLLVDAYIQHKSEPRVLVMGRVARALCKCLGESRAACKVVLGETTLEKLDMNDLADGLKPVLLPVPQSVESDPELASEENFDLVISGEPMGYLEVGDYAEKLKPFIKRREKEEEKSVDQVQWVCIELSANLEDARDELYSAGYYKAEHDKAFEPLRKAAAGMQYGVALFSLPSQEKEQRKRRDELNAVERRRLREKEEEKQARKEEEDEQRRGVLYETLFDPLLSPAEIASLPIALEVGAEQGQADLVFFWLHSNDEKPEAWREVMEELATSSGGRLRIVAPTFPEGQLPERWYAWSDEVAVNYGMEFFEMSDGPTDEAIEKAKKEPAKNVSFGKPTVDELRCIEELEVCCKQLINLIEEEVTAGLHRGSKIALGGFSQGGSVAVYSALSHTAPEQVQESLCAVVPCCSGVPVFHFLAPKMQKTCLDSRDSLVFQQPISVHMVYGKDDPEVKSSFVETTRDLYRRFDFPTTLHRFTAPATERFPIDVQRAKLSKIVGLLLGSCSDA